MPFIVNVNAENAGTKEVSYSFTPSPKKTELSDELKEQLKSLDIDKTVEKLKEYRDKALMSNKAQDELPTIQQDEEYDDDKGAFITKKDVERSQKKSEPSEFDDEDDEDGQEIPF
jgi:hypothetical protein